LVAAPDQEHQGGDITPNAGRQCPTKQGKQKHGGGTSPHPGER